MDSYEYGELLKRLKNAIENIRKIIKPDELTLRLQEIENLQQDPNFWNDAKKAGDIGKEKSKITRLLDTYQSAQRSIDDASELFELSQNDTDTLELLFEESSQLEDSIKHVEIAVMLSGEHDSNNAIVTIQPGAGGTESQDWGSILYRMYLRWCERRGFKAEILDYQDGEEAGIKGVAFIIKGENAYGYMKSENGVHRMVRLSPFNAESRETSFALVEVLPKIDAPDEVQIDDKDLRIDIYRSGGHGGQGVNTTDSAVRITHLPTNTVVTIQNERSQIQNKAKAMEILRGKLVAMQLEQHAASLGELRAGDSASWGSQIRNYVLHPYKLVKDTRTKHEEKDVEAVLDGRLKGFQLAYLEQLHS